VIELISRQRVLRDLDHQDVDYLPCAFMSFTALRKRLHEDMFELSKAELGMGLDSLSYMLTPPRPNF
jgi:hypothetical protein